MSKKSLTEHELLDRLDASLASDVLTEAYSQEEVAEAIKAAGGDPAEVGQRGAELAKQLLKKRRLDWQRTAKERLAETQRASVELDLTRLSRKELLEAFDEARRDPSLSGLMGAFRKRKPEQASEEELRALLSEIRTLGSIMKAKDKRRASKNE